MVFALNSCVVVYRFPYRRFAFLLTTVAATTTQAAEEFVTSSGTTTGFEAYDFDYFTNYIRISGVFSTERQSISISEVSSVQDYTKVAKNLSNGYTFVEHAPTIDDHPGCRHRRRVCCASCCGKI